MTRRLTTAAVLFLASAGAHAQQNYPDKAVRLIVPYAAGGNADLLGRVVGQKLGEMFSQQFIIDNRAGANGVIGTELVARSVPDGYTISFNTTSGFLYNPFFYKSVTYDVLKDFTPVTFLGDNTYFVAVHPAIPAKTINELLAYAKANPKTLNFPAGNTYALVATSMFAAKTPFTGPLVLDTTTKSPVCVPWPGSLTVSVVSVPVLVAVSVVNAFVTPVAESRTGVTS